MPFVSETYIHETAEFKLELLTSALEAAAQAKKPVTKPAKKDRRQ